MTHRFVHIRCVTAVLLISFTGVGISQVGMQQLPGSSSGVSSSTRNQPDTATAPGSPGLAGNSPGLTMVPEDFAKLKLAPGFLMSLNVLDDPDFTGTFRIDQQGDIALPILGIMHVADETTSEVRIQIQKKLLDGQILRDPQVNLAVLEYTAPEVIIAGEVVKPGRYPLLVPRKLVDVLALAGGTTFTAGNEVQIIHSGFEAKSVLIHFSKATNPKAVTDAIVYPGDTVQVKRAGIVYVLGAVTRPGGYVMQEDGTLNVLQAIPMAGGTAITAKTDTMYLLRRNGDGSVVYITLPYNKIVHAQSADVQLQPKDVLYVPTNKIKSILINGEGILAAAGSASIYAGVTH